MPGGRRDFLRQKAGKLILFLLILQILTGCQGKALPGGMKEETLLAHGREVTVLLAGGQYEEVLSRMREDVASTVTAEEIQSLVLTQTEGAGVYKQISSAMTTGQSSQGEDYGVAVIYCDYSKDHVLFRLAFDANYALIGMEVKRQ